MVKELDDILNELESIGSNKDELKRLKKMIVPLLEQNNNLEIIINNIIDKILIESKRFLNLKNKDYIQYITGFTSSIYLPTFDGSGEVNILLTGGVSSRISDNKIDEDTLFDIASVTKLFTLILVLKLSEDGIINLDDKIVDINPDFKGLEDYTFNDLLRLHGILATDLKISSASNYKEAYNILKTIYLKNNTRKKNKYNDLGAIIIGKTIEKVMSKRLGKDLNLNDIMNEYIFKKADMFNTTYNPNSGNISGNGGYDNLVHDPSTRILNGITGSAGIFTTSSDLNKFAYALYNNKLLSKDSLKKIGEITFLNSFQCGKGNLGVYVKSDKPNKTFVPRVFTNNSFAHQGWTGAIAIFDPNNNIHFSFLPNTILKDDKYIHHDKPIGYIEEFYKFEDKIVDYIMMIYIIKKYYKVYKKQDIKINKYIKI